MTPLTNVEQFVMAWHDKIAPHDKKFHHVVQYWLSWGAILIHITSKIVLWGKIAPDEMKCLQKYDKYHVCLALSLAGRSLDEPEWQNIALRYKINIARIKSGWGLREWVSAWQGHLLSCLQTLSGQLTIIFIWCALLNRVCSAEAWCMQTRKFLL